MKKLAFLCGLAALAALPAPAARASILLAGNFQTGTPTPTLSISSPFSLTITAAGDVTSLAFANWVTTNNGSAHNVYAFNGSQLVSYRIGNGAVQTVPAYFLYDNNAVAAPGTPGGNDGVLGFLSSIPVTAGQTLTFLPGSVAFSPAANFSPYVPAVFNGNAYVLNSITVLSVPASVNQVPEPSTWAAVAFGAAGVGFVLSRRRRAAAL